MSRKIADFDVYDAFNRAFTFEDWVNVLEKIGWKPDRLNGQFPTFTRPDKSGGASGELLIKGDVILFHNFSSSTDFPSKRTGKNTYSPVEVINYFFFNNDWKKSTPYFKESLKGHSVRYKPIKKAPRAKGNEISFNGALQDLVIDQSGVRKYRLSINQSVINKNLNPKTLQPFAYLDYKTKEMKPCYKVLNSQFRNYEITANEIADMIGKGHALCNSILNEDESGLCYRKTENWKGSELIIIDIDKGLTIDECLKLDITQKALLLYTTPNHTHDKHRYRIIFDLPYFENDKTRYKKLIESFIKKYNSDEQASSITNCFYGNRDAIVYFLRTNQKRVYSKGTFIHTTSLNDSEPLEDLQWYEVHYLNEKKYYVKDVSISNVKAAFQRNGIILKDIKPIHYDATTHQITYLTLN